MYALRNTALLKDNLVIKILKDDELYLIDNYDYDRTIDCKQYPILFSVGDTILPNGKIERPDHYSSWWFDENQNKWIAPMPFPKDLNNEDNQLYRWDEDDMRFHICIDCAEEAAKLAMENIVFDPNARLPDYEVE